MPRLAGAVLTGGASRRMGRDKALVEVDGRPLAARVAEVLRDAGASPVLWVGGDLPSLDGLGIDGVRGVPDDHPGEGPLGGVLTALRHAERDGAELTVVMPTDLLDPDLSLARRLVALVADGGDLAVPVVGGRAQWICAAWRTTRARQHLALRFAGGERAMWRAVDGLDVRRLADVDPAVVRDADSPDDLAERH